MKSIVKWMTWIGLGLLAVAIWLWISAVRANGQTNVVDLLNVCTNCPDPTNPPVALPHPIWLEISFSNAPLNTSMPEYVQIGRSTNLINWQPFEAFPLNSTNPAPVDFYISVQDAQQFFRFEYRSEP